MKNLVLTLSIFMFLAGFSVSQANELFGVTSPELGLNGRVEKIELVSPESILYRIDPQTGNSVEIGPTGFLRCTGLDFEPGTNNLFAICRRFEERNGDPAAMSRGEEVEEIEILVKVDINTGQAQEIGPLLIENSNPLTGVTDMSFDSNGVLYVYVINVGNPIGEMSLDQVDTKFVFDEDDRLGVVNTETGKYTEIGPTGFINLISGIAFSQINDLYQAGAQEINLFSKLNQQTGEASPKFPLMLPPEIVDRLNIVSSMDLQTSTNSLFAVISSQDFNGGAPGSLTRNGVENVFNLTFLNPTNGVVSIIGPTVDGLSAIAFLNRDRTEIPTISEIGSIIMAAVLLGGAVLFLARRRQIQAN